MEPLRAEAARRREAQRTADAALLSEEQRWQTTASRIAKEFRDLKDHLGRLKQSHERLVAEHATRWQALQQQARGIQLRIFLQGTFISDHKISNVGPTRQAALASFGIETAWDVEVGAILDVPGIGEKLARNLLIWRQQVEQTFRFDPAVGVPDHERRSLNAYYDSNRLPLEMQLTGGEAQLRKIAGDGLAELNAILVRIRGYVTETAQASANTALLPPGV
jgi:DNA-binding helix-hairpin-helix protein with protein kinase domain